MKNLKIFFYINYVKIPNISIIDDVEELLESNLNLYEDSNVKEHRGDRVYRGLDQDFIIERAFGNGWKRERFKNTMKSIFNCKLFIKKEKYNVLSFQFSELMSYENMMFPMYLLIYKNEKFKIEYLIKSKLTSNIEKGEIKVR